MKEKQLSQKKLEIMKLIDEEHGEGFCKNIDLSGYTFYKRDSFISFKLKKVNNIQTAIIKYIYCTNKQDFIKLISFSINFFAGMNVKFIYFLEHTRSQNYTKKYLSALGFTVIEEKRQNVWRYDFKALRDKDEILEAFI